MCGICRRGFQSYIDFSGVGMALELLAFCSKHLKNSKIVVIDRNSDTVRLWNEKLKPFRRRVSNHENLHLDLFGVI